MTVTEKSGGNNGQCFTDAPLDRINSEIIPTIAPAAAGGWMYRPPLSQSNYDSCADLSYVELVQRNIADGGFETVLLMLHKDEYLGVYYI